MNILICGSLVKSLYDFRKDYVNLLLANNCKVTIICLSDDVSADLFYIDYFRFQGVDIIVLRRMGMPFLTFLSYLHRLIRLNFVFDKALVYTPIAVVPFSLVATFKRRVVSIVYLTGLGILGKFPFKFFLIYVKLIASKFIVQNNEDYSFLKSLGCSVVNLGCTGCALPDFEKDYHTSDIINVLYLGRIINAKGNKILFDLIDFYGSCDSKLVFHVAGYSTKEVHARLIELQTRFPNNLRFYGLIRDEERITRLLKFCDVLIYPTVFNEGVPRSIQEAMSFGLPVISNQNRGVDELFIPNYNMLYANYNFPSYKQVLDDFSKLEFRHRRILGQRNRLMASLFCVSKKQSELLFHVTMS